MSPATPHVISYNSAVATLAVERWRQALDLAQAMPSSRLVPDVSCTEIWARLV